MSGTGVRRASVLVFVLLSALATALLPSVSSGAQRSISSLEDEGGDGGTGQAVDRGCNVVAKLSLNERRA